MSTNQSKKPVDDQRPNDSFLKSMLKKGKRLLKRIQDLLEQTAKQCKPLLGKLRNLWKKLLQKSKVGLSKLIVLLKKLMNKVKYKLRDCQRWLKQYWEKRREAMVEKKSRAERLKKQVTQVSAAQPQEDAKKTPVEQTRTQVDPVSDGQAAVKTRKQHKQHLKQQKKQRKKPRRRIFPIWLRIVVVVVFLVIALISGVMIGFGVIGDGKPLDALDKSTWQHIIDIVKKEK
ncbi:DNA-directed RNA polymerase subunit beta [Lentibacillus sp. N15]|uniref:DNA-directed RNA polymerase subunit beta n=1 Tax=Lentibacillus songyuanensis TaxID=3136161 RepID=UPI0031BB74CE